ncbi:hypothetical protein DFQ26_002391 [Actinomortierella ambigua]|nr:hypothetical protein DFQ26_002391 [Actinomortierella ambigua]
MASGPVDLRASARDMLALGQKVCSVLKRHAERLTKELEYDESHLSPESDSTQAEECQQIINLRSQVQNGIETLRAALEDAEDVQDDEVPRVLREPMDTLQAQIRTALQIASTAEGGTKMSSTTVASRTATTSSRSPSPLSNKGRLSPIPMATSNGSGGMFAKQHSVGLYSTSPKFPGGFPGFSKLGTSPFRSSMEGDRRSSLEQSQIRDDNSDTSESGEEDGVPRIPSADKGKQRAVSPDPLAELVQIPPTSSAPAPVLTKTASKPIAKPTTTTINTKSTVASKKKLPSMSSTVSSTAGFDPLSSFMAEAEAEAVKASPPPSAPKKTQAAPAPATPKTPTAAKISQSTPASAPSSSFNRRVPRGLFSSSLAESTPPPSRPEPPSEPAVAPPQSSSLSWNGSLAPSPHIPTSTAAVAAAQSPVEPAPTAPMTFAAGNDMKQASGINVSQVGPDHSMLAVEDPMPRRSRLSRHLASTNSPTSPSFPRPLSTSNSPAHPASPTSPPSSTDAVPSATSSRKPTQTQTDFAATSSSTLSSPPFSSSRNATTTKTSTSTMAQEERLSKLVQDLEQAMNPTPTEPAPQPIFLQGSKLVLLPNDSDDGLDDGGGAGAHGSDEVGYIRIGGGSSSSNTPTLRRQRSIGRKGLRILSRSRSRPGRSNSMSESSGTSIVIGAGGTITNTGTINSSSGTSRSRSRSRTGMLRRLKHYPPQPIAIGTVPLPVLADGVGWVSSDSSSLLVNNPSSGVGGSMSDLLENGTQGRSRVVGNNNINNNSSNNPFANEVTVSHPVRIGRGIGSFTVYTITLTLCSPLAYRNTNGTLPTPPPLQPVGSSSSIHNHHHHQNGLSPDPEHHAETAVIPAATTIAVGKSTIAQDGILRSAGKVQRDFETSPATSTQRPILTPTPTSPTQSITRGDFGEAPLVTNGAGHGSTASTHAISPTRNILSQQQQQQQQHIVDDDHHLPSSPGTAAVIAATASASEEETKPTCKASIAAMQMTHSMSFPELSRAAERLLLGRELATEQEGRHLHQQQQQQQSRGGSGSGPNGAMTPSAHRRAATTPSSSLGLWSGEEDQQEEAEHGLGQQQQNNGGSATTATAAATTGPSFRVIQVRKRYSDFVVLRARIVATFKEPRRKRRIHRRSQGSQPQQPTAATVASAGSSLGTTTGAAAVGGVVAPLSPRPRPGLWAARGSSGGGGRRSASFMSSFSNRSIEDDDDDEEEEEEEDEEDDDDDDEYYSDISQSQPSRSTTTWIQLGGLPKLPPKKVMGKFKPEFVEKRRRDLEYFLQWVVAHPVLGQSAVVVQWFLES